MCFCNAAPPRGKRIALIEGWRKRRDELVKNAQLTHRRTGEYASYIMEAIETGAPIKIGGNVMNTGLIANLPRKACVEVPCLVDRSGVQGCYVGELPEQCAALNRTSINVQIRLRYRAASRVMSPMPSTGACRRPLALCVRASPCMIAGGGYRAQRRRLRRVRRSRAMEGSHTWTACGC